MPSHEGLDPVLKVLETFPSLALVTSERLLCRSGVQSP